MLFEATPANWFAHMKGRRAFRTVASTLSEHGVPVLLVKGLLTARLLYDDVAMRPTRDVDIRLRHGDFKRACRVARAAGWHARHVALLGQALWKVEGMEVDVKCALGPPGLCTLAIEEVMQRAEARVDPFEVPHLEPELHDHALLLVLNVFKDGLESTPWAIEDLRRITRVAGFDPVQLVERAARGRVLTALWIVADWLAHAHEGWREVRDRIGPSPLSARAARLYALWRRARCPRRVGHFVIPAVGDGVAQSAAGLAVATAGLVRGYSLRVFEETFGRSRGAGGAT